MTMAAVSVFWSLCVWFTSFFCYVRSVVFITLFYWVIQKFSTSFFLTHNCDLNLDTLVIRVKCKI